MGGEGNRKVVFHGYRVSVLQDEKCFGGWLPGPMKMVSLYVLWHLCLHQALGHPEEGF